MSGENIKESAYFLGNNNKNSGKLATFLLFPFSVYLLLGAYLRTYVRTYLPTYSPT